MRLLCAGGACLVAVSAALATANAQSPARPNLSGFWSAGRQVPPDVALVKALPPNTVVLADAGAVEFPVGEFGGLQPKPAAAAAARTWKPEHDMTVDRVCLPPSIVYAMRGPFPMEIHQTPDLIVMRLENTTTWCASSSSMGVRTARQRAAHEVGHSVGRWEGSTLVVDTTHLSASTITNNGLNHSDKVHLIERFWLAQWRQDADDAAGVRGPRRAREPRSAIRRLGSRKRLHLPVRVRSELRGELPEEVITTRQSHVRAGSSLCHPVACS